MSGEVEEVDRRVVDRRSGDAAGDVDAQCFVVVVGHGGNVRHPPRPGYPDPAVPDGPKVAAIIGSDTVGTERQRTPGVDTEMCIFVVPGAMLTEITLSRSRAEIDTFRPSIVTEPFSAVDFRWVKVMASAWREACRPGFTSVSSADPHTK